MKTNVTKMMVMAIVTLALTACSKSDFFDEHAVENNAKAQYAANFAKKYPHVDMSKGWDFSTKNTSYSLGNRNNNVRTRAGQGTWGKEDWYYVDNSTLDWMHTQLVEHENHQDIGKPFYMTVPGEDFYVVPIYQGLASAVWELHVVIGDEDILFWGKSEDIEIKDLGKPEWHKVWEYASTYEWDRNNPATFEYMFNTDGNGKTLPDGVTKNTVTDVRTKPRKFSGYPVGADMYFYLKVTTGDPGYCNAGAEQSSLNGQMLHLNCPRPSNIPAEYETMIIGCEDANLENADYDMNDLVLLVYGPQVPKPIEISEGTPVIESKTVRYMIEDLGATDDFDFNDIVIDMVEATSKTPVYTNGKLTEWKRGETTQKAIIRHLGGTLPFILTIGNTEYAAGGQSTFQTSPDTEIDVTGWTGLSGNHNISIQVQQNNGNQGSGNILYNTVKFPKAGEAPMIIAVDPTQNWMPERQSVPESWFYTTDTQE